MNAKTYKRHVQKELLPAVQRLYKHKNWVLYKAMQHHTVRTSYKIFLQ